MRTLTIRHSKAAIRRAGIPVTLLFLFLTAVSYLESRERVEVLVSDVALLRDEFRGYSLSVEKPAHLSEGKFLVLSRDPNWKRIVVAPFLISLFILGLAILAPWGKIQNENGA